MENAREPVQFDVVSLSVLPDRLIKMAEARVENGKFISR